MAEPPRAPAAGPELTVVLTTVADPAAGARLARQLVQERLIACANLIPGLESVYRWNDEVVQEGETLVLMKTAPERVAELFSRIGELHPYEVPELVALPVAEASHAYCRWVRQETTEVSA